MKPKALVTRLQLPTGLELAYLARGSDQAIPVLLLHAWGESRRAFDRLVALLPGTVRLMALDQRGHGDADVPDTGYSCVALALTGWLVVGFSWFTGQTGSSWPSVDQALQQQGPWPVTATLLVLGSLFAAGPSRLARRLASGWQ